MAPLTAPPRQIELSDKTRSELSKAPDAAEPSLATTTASHHRAESRQRRATRRRRRQRGARLGLITLDAILALVVVAAVVMVVGVVSGWWRTAVVLSGSMRPGIQPGDIEVLMPEPPRAVRVGQILAVRPPGRNSTFTHRVVQVTHADGHVVIRTKGDANDVDDPWGRIAITSSKAWQVKMVIPELGWVARAVSFSKYRVFVLCGLVLLCCIWMLGHIWRRDGTAKRSSTTDPTTTNDMPAEPEPT